MYTTLSSSTIDTQGFIYNNSFNTSYPDENLMSFDDDGGGSNKQFMITLVLEAMTKYILFVTTYPGNTLGNFSITGLGPGTINFLEINSSKIQSKSNYSSALNTSSPVYIHYPDGPTMSYFQAIDISVLTTGIYTILSNSTIDTYGYMYNGTFNPADTNQNLMLSDDDSGGNPNQNLLASDDDSGGSSQFMLANILQPMTKYILVVTTYAEGVTGRFTLIGKGPDSISYSLTNVSKVASNYSSALTTNSSRFCRTGNCSASIYYYQAIQLNVSTTGTYTILCSSTIDTYGYLYNNTFNSSTLSLNQIASDDDSGGNSQFMFLILLQAVGKYILIVTTYNQNVTGSFSIISTGVSPVGYVKP
ncbi:unnamed protein product [Adineta steineri]|uniref:Uncharacterized protein n=1 Tax=Adineta steineri TaxID=433720 RepID=A0A814B7K2_9BILA|nr:unnamed protein product [Adineta steineri]CAF3654287.1 unnamed protein product [Adineta steineri]